MKVKKLISFILAIALIMSSNTISAFADGVSLGGNTNSGGGMTVGSDAAYAHKMMAYPDNMGYRISIVNKTGERVANSVDIVNYVPSDINSMSFNNSSAGGGKQEVLNGYQQYKSWIGWANYTGTSLNKENLFYYSNGIKTEEFNEYSWNKAGVPTHINSMGETIETNMYPKTVFEGYLGSEYKYQAETYQSDFNTLGTNVTLSTTANLTIPLPCILNSSKTAFTPGGVELQSLMQQWVGYPGVTTLGANQPETKNILSMIVDMTTKLYDNRGQSKNEFGYLFRFSNSAEQARVGKQETDKLGEVYTVKQSTIITEKGYKVIIEPLFWYVPEIMSTHPSLMALSKCTLEIF
jgi:hypothetical protein